MAKHPRVGRSSGVAPLQGDGSFVAQVTRRFVITGKVQGVYFRHSTRLEADRLALRGVARNLPDGSVEVIAQGAHEAVETLREWLLRGPVMARVAAVVELESGGIAEEVGGSNPAPVSFSIE